MDAVIAIIKALRETAARWQDPEYPPRADAVAKTLGAPNTFTEEAVAFAVNQQMHLLQEVPVEGWCLEGRPSQAVPIAVFNSGQTPLDDLPDFLAVVLAGHRYRGSVNAASPYLLPAFVEEVQALAPALDAAFVPDKALLDGAGAMMAFADEDFRLELAARADAAGLDPARRLIRRVRTSVAVLDGRESLEDLEDLSVDLLLHEGRSPRNVSVVWAPRGHAPDGLLNALASFRGVFPAHASTPGSLKMQQAFLKAAGQPHAFGEGLEFLVSKGPPETQPPGHVRWVEYDDLDAVRDWLRDRAEEIAVVVARSGMAPALEGTCPVVPPGMAHRPELHRPDYAGEARAFVCAL